MRVRGAPLLLTFIAMHAAGEARATPPPIFEPDDAFDSAWEGATEAFKLCATRADAGRRAGTVWVDVWVPAHGGDHERARGRPTFNVRTSPGLVAADRISRYLPPLASLFPAWRELARAPGNAAARSRLSRSLRPLGTVAPDGCLLVHREERLQRARAHWLAGGAREVLRGWQSLVDKLARPNRVRDPYLFVVDGALLIAAERIDGGRSSPRRPRQSPDWSRTLETYCLRPLDERLRAEVDRGIDEIAACVSGAGTERLVAPRLEPPPDRMLHVLSMSSWRTCGIDQTGAIVCCGVRGDAPPAGTFSAVSADEKYGCAIRSNGELACWGEAPLGAKPPAGRFTRLHVRGGGCAITAERSVRCWGVPTGWEAPPGEYVDVALGPTREGSVMCWGAGWPGGLLGMPVLTGTVPDRSTP